MADLNDDFSYSVGSLEAEPIVSKLIKEFNIPGNDVCITPAREFSICRDFVTDDEGLTLVFREDVTRKKNEGIFSDADTVFYFDVKKKVFTVKTKRTDDIKLAYMTGESIVLKRPRNVRGKIRTIEGVVKCTLNEGSCLYISDEKRKITKMRQCTTVCVMGIVFSPDDTIALKEDIEARWRLMGRQHPSYVEDS